MAPRGFPFTASVLLIAAAGLCSAVTAQAPEGGSGIPLRDVVLFSSGVGYFQRSGRVDGPASLSLSFRAEQVNDILKSLVLFDPAGNVRPVTYATNDAALRRPGGPGQAPDPSISLGTLLRQFQGAMVRLQMGGTSVEGRILSISTKEIPVDGRPGALVRVDVINVVTETGLRAIPLEQVTQVKLLDARLDRELRRSLETLSTGLNEQRRNVELKFAGGGAREVRAGYLQETPVWKTSYRLVLSDKEKPYLQGWAIVENTTDEDWNNVHLSLISGRPVSFIQDLYQPLYVPRPVVQAQVIGSPTPQTYGEDLLAPSDERASGVDGKVARMPRITGAVNLGFRAAAVGGAGGGSAGEAGPAGPPGPSGRPSAELNEARRKATFDVASSALAQSVASEAQGGGVGELFAYSIEQPVSIAKGQAAMVPIVTASVTGEKISVYDPASDATHALNGFRLKNNTKLQLSGGPITLFEDGIYAGDAQIGTLRPGEDRFLSYAVDLDLVAAREAPRQHQETLSLSAKSGVLVVTRKQQQVNTYTFRNKSDQAKKVLVQQAIVPEFSLAEPAKPSEKTADAYRFRVPVPAGKTEPLKVVTERPVREEIALIDADLNLLVAYAQNGKVSEKLRGALKDLVARRRKISDLQAQRAARENDVKAIDAEQARIRQNMAQLDRTNALYQQYVKKLTDQETRIEHLREEMARLREAENQARNELRQYVDNLTLEA